jgi:hypothetical protein
MEESNRYDNQAYRGQKWTDEVTISEDNFILPSSCALKTGNYISVFTQTSCEFLHANTFFFDFPIKPLYC